MYSFETFLYKTKLSKILVRSKVASDHGEGFTPCNLTELKHCNVTLSDFGRQIENQKYIGPSNGFPMHTNNVKLIYSFFAVFP